MREEALHSFDTKRRRHGFGAVAYLPYRAPPQRLVAKRKNLRPATVLLLCE